MLHAYAAGGTSTQEFVLLYAMPCRFPSMLYPLVFEVKAVIPTVYQLGPFGPAFVQSDDELAG